MTAPREAQPQMTGADHFDHAHWLLDGLDDRRHLDDGTYRIQKAIAHAVLALAAAVERQTSLAHGVDAGGYGR